MSKLIFDIPADISYVKTAVLKVMDFLNDTVISIQEDEFFEIKVILNELILNSINHGVSIKKNSNVRVIAGISKRCYFYLIIQDNGKGYNLVEVLECCNNLADTIEELQECGRGMLIVKNLCDCIKTNSKGNKVIVLKKLSVE